MDPTQRTVPKEKRRDFPGKVHEQSILEIDVFLDKWELVSGEKRND